MIKRFRSRPIPTKVLLLIFIAGIAALAFWMINKRADQPEINDFDSCAESGNPVLETNPPQCTYKGQSFFRQGEAPYDPKQDLLQ